MADTERLLLQGSFWAKLGKNFLGMKFFLVFQFLHIKPRPVVIISTYYNVLSPAHLPSCVSASSTDHLGQPPHKQNLYDTVKSALDLRMQVERFSDSNTCSPKVLPTE